MNPSAPAPVVRISLPSHSPYLPILKSARVFAQASLLAVGLLVSVTSATAQVTPFPTTVVKQPSLPISVTVTMTAGGTSTTPGVLTEGISGLDYAAAGGTCTANQNYNVGDTCTVNVIFTPLYPGRRDGAVAITTSNGALLGSALMTGTGVGSLAVLVPGEINTVVGNNAWLYAGDGVLATNASIYLPMGVVTDAAGNIFLSDSSNNRIRRVDATTGLISTIAGDGNPGFAGDNGPAKQAEISSPAGLILDGAGNIYFADTGNDVIRRIDAFSGFITTVAGMGNAQGYSGNNGVATSAKLSSPEGVAFDTAQNMYITDTGNNVIREVNALTSIITTIAGTATAGYNGDGVATTKNLNAPWGLSVGPDGTIYFADLTNNMVRMVSTAGILTTISGTGQLGFSGDGSTASAAILNAPASIILDPAGDAYIADSGNNRIREITPSNGSLPNGTIQTVAGTGDEQFSGDLGPANAANLYGPYGLFFDQSGNLFITDMFHNRIREVSATTISLLYPTMRVGKVSNPPMVEGVLNDGNAVLNITTPTFNNSELDAATTTCNAGTTLAQGLQCNLGIDFAPTTVGDPVDGTLKFNSDAGNAPTLIKLSGDVLSVNPTSVSVSSSLDPSLVGQAVTFTATISAGGATTTGTVTILNGNVAICTATVNANNIAACTAPGTSLQLGVNSITASYGGDPNDASAVSGVLSQLVQQASTITLTAAPNPATVTATVTLTATITANSGTPAGSITFYSDGTAIGSANLVSGVATYSTTTLSAATHSLTAKYVSTPNDVDASATSNAVSEVVQKDTTQTMLGTSSATVAVGTTVTFTATVTSSAVGSNNGPAPTQTVQFNDVTNPNTPVLLGTGTIASGVATLSIASLAPGSHTIGATYVGDNNDATSTSQPLVETIQQIGTATILTGSPNPANAGASVLLTANVAMVAGAVADGVITGSVTFSYGSTVLGTAVLGANGTASVSVSTLPVGTDGIVAVYSGNTNYATSTSNTLSEQIDQTTTNTVLNSSNLNAYEGKSVTFTAVVTSSTGTPTGAVNFLDNGKNVGSGTLSAGGVATLMLSNLPTGTQSMVAVYVGNNSYDTSTSAPISEVISLGTPTVTLAGPASPVNAGVPVTLTGTISSNGVTPTDSLTLLDGTTAIATQNAPASGSFSFPASTLSIGTHTLTVSYAGDANNSSATSNVFVITVQQASTSTTLTSSINPQIVGQPVTFTAGTSSAGPNLMGSITFMDNGASIGSVNLNAAGAAVFTTSSLPVGTNTVTAVYSGDANHVASTSTPVSEQIVQIAGVSLTSSVNPSVAGQDVVFTMKVSGNNGVVPTGTVTFTDGSTALGTATLDGTGAGSFQSAVLAVGTHNIKASYGGDKNYAAASATLVQTVQNASTQISVAASANPAIYGTPLSLTATIMSNGISATGSVTFTDGSASIGSAVLNANGVATLTISTLAPGPHSIIANYAGDGKAAASVSSPLALVVKETTNVALASNANPALTLAPIVLTAAVSNSGIGQPTGTVTFNDGSTLLGTATVNSSGVATLNIPSLAAGTHTITASYAGDGDNFSSASASLAQIVQLRPTTTALTATETNANNPLQVTLISVERWNGPVVPTGTVTFMNGGQIIGTSVVDNTGVATITIVLQAPTENITATYAGDTVYAGSTSPSVAVSGGQATQFTMALNPPALTLSSTQHGVTTLTLSSVQNFADTLALGCDGLPYAASCTFSTTQAKLTAGGLTTVTLTVDTGNPLGSGGEDASLAQKHSSGMMLAFLPIGLLAGYGLFRTRRRSLLGLLLVVCAVAATLGVTGCGGLQVNGTPPGTYTIKVTAVGQGTGVSQTENLTLTVTQ